MSVMLFGEDMPVLRDGGAGDGIALPYGGCVRGRAIAPSPAAASFSQAMSISARTPAGACSARQSAAVTWTVGTQITKYGHIPHRFIGS